MFVAVKVGMMDHPGHRKQHQSPTPLVGGIAVYLAVLAAAILNPSVGFSFTLLSWIGLVLLIGVLDDLFDVSYRIRLLCHACIVVGIFATSGLAVGDIGSVLGNGTVHMGGPVAIFFTIVAVVGVVNAVNMSDGADGLLGSLVTISLIAIFLIALRASESVHLITSQGIAMLIGAMAGFMLFNSRIGIRKRASVFMGDAGSTALGFVLAYLLIEYSQGVSAPISPVVAGWIIGLPLLDASGVILYRVLSRRSPFKPDRSHLHHLLLDAGTGVNRTVIIMSSIHTIMIGVSSLAYGLFGDASEAYLFWGFVVLVCARAFSALWYGKKLGVEPASVTGITHDGIPDVSVMIGTIPDSTGVVNARKTKVK